VVQQRICIVRDREAGQGGPAEAGHYVRGGSRRALADWMKPGTTYEEG
jgi:hypothetical protein